MIDSSLLDALKQHLHVKKSAIYEKIKVKRKSLAFAVDSDQAALLLAGESGIDISKFARPEQISEIRRFVTPIETEKRPVPAAPSRQRTRLVGAPSFKLPSGAAQASAFLPSAKLSEASKMAETYVVSYLFENSVRALILEAMQKHGANWWETKVSRKIREEVQKRQRKEKDNPWHGQRGSHPIYYTDIGHLTSIISRNWPDVKPFIEKDQDWIRVKLDEIEFTRNIIAHHNPLENRDRQRLEIYFGDWIRQLRQPPARTEAGDN